MEFNGKDSFLSNLNYEFTAEDQRSLTLFYLPLIEEKAFALYHLLMNVRKGRGETLCALAACDIYALGEALQKLTDFGLLRTYYNSNAQLFKFLLEKPLNGPQFMKQALFGRLYLEKTGTAAFNEVAVMLAKEEFITDEDEPLTSDKRDFATLKTWKEKDEEAFQKLRDRFLAVDGTAFDIKSFLNDCSELTFPSHFRTEETLRLISSMATVYGLDRETMRKLFLKTLNNKTGEIDWEALRTKCLSAKEVRKQEEITYTMSPVQFLYYKQHELPVAKAEKRLLEYLQLEVKLPNEVINCLVEYALDTNNMKLNASYIEKIAVTWARQNVDTLEKAKAKLAEPGFTPRRKGPDFDWEPEEEAQDLEQLRRELFREE